MIKNDDIVVKSMETKAPKGTRDFLPQEMVKRQFVIDTIRAVYEKYGFEPMQTPVFESWDVLKAKSGEEAKNQIYYFKDKSDRELGLRFDLTIGMARVIAENLDLPKPVKRFVIDKAWRYEEISKGRYREFVQADIDIVGIKENTAEAECISCIVEALNTLGISNLKIRIGSRKLLDLLVKELKLEDNYESVLRAIDKLDKIGQEGIRAELLKVTSEKNTEKILKFTEGKLKIRGSNEIIKSLKELQKKIKLFGTKDQTVIDYSLVRGLGYYTGTVVEIMSGDYGKTVAAGGRYDNLLGIYGSELPAVGLSIGVERAVDIMDCLNLFEKAGIQKTNIKCFVAPINENVLKEAVKITQKIRKAGISCMLDLQNRGLSKNLEYCNSKGIPKIVIVGPRDLKEKKVTVKNLDSGEEQKVELGKVARVIK